MKSKFLSRWGVLGLGALVAVLLLTVYSIFVVLTREDGSGYESTYSPPITEVEVAPIAAFVGDGYTQGAGAEPREQRWSTQLSRLMNWRERNFGLGGTGYVAEAESISCAQVRCVNYLATIDDVVSGRPEIVVVAGAQQDFREFAENPEFVVDAIQTVYRRIRSALPDAEMVAVGPSTPAAVSGTVIAYDKAVQDAADSVGALYVSLIDPNVIQPEYLLQDGIHVNNQGHTAIRQRVQDVLTATR